jgi:tetratricopeptide (TPR) repeat protein
MTLTRINTLLKFLEESPDDTFLLFALAQEYKQLAQFEPAISWYIKLKNLDPDYVGLYYHLAESYAKLDDLTNAMVTYDEGMAIARKLNDQHALSELSNARTNLEMEML